jgi:hypothetical protein
MKEKQETGEAAQSDGETSQQVRRPMDAEVKTRKTDAHDEKHQERYADGS